MMARPMRSFRRRSTLPPRLEPARPFYDALAELLAEAVLRDLRELKHGEVEQSAAVEARPDCAESQQR